MPSPRIRWLLFFALLALAAAILLQPIATQIVAPILPQPPPTAVPVAEPSIYSEAIAGRPRDINPLLSDFNDADQDLVALLFSGLTTNDANGEVRPALAQSWDVSDDGLNYTFALRRDVKWHDGTLFTSRDVSATVALLQAPEFPAPPALTDFWRRVSVTTPSEYTVIFTLSEPFAPFMSYTSLGLLPARIVEKIPPTQWPDRDFNAHPIGTGPFRVKRIDQGHSTITLEPFPDYYGIKPQLDRVELHFYPSEAAALAAYQRGEVLGVAHVPASSLPDARRIESLSLYATPLSGFDVLYLNLRNPLFQQKEVRQALLLALDRQRIVDRSLDGQGLVAHSPLLPDQWAYNRFVKKYAPDADAAKALLAQTGWKVTDGILTKGNQKLEFAIMSSDDPTQVRVIEEITRQWDAIGVKAHPQVTGFSGLARDFLRPRKFDTIFLRWRDPSSDPDQYALWHSTRISDEGQNYASWQNRDADELLEQARRDPDPKHRADLYAKFQDVFADQVPSLLISYPIYVYAVDQRVQHVQVGPLTRASDRFRTIASWTIEPKVAAPAVTPQATATATATN
ncbi:MAG: peptide ABC transporter substrate-binding protein [Chloroflexota bacterium]